jgi:hypothetical protein
MPQNLVYLPQGGDKLVIASGGILDASGANRGDIKANLDGNHAGTIGDANTTAGLPVVHRIDIADGAGDTDVTADHKIRVIDAWAVKTDANGGSGDTVTVKNGSSAITDALDLNVSDTAIARAGQIDDANHEIAADGTLKVTAANNTNNACVVYVLGVRVA